MIARRLAAFLAACVVYISAAFGQAPPPVPPLPDAPRINQQTLSGSTCGCAVNFAIYGDNTDIDNWLQVFINNTAVLSTDPVFGWSLTSPTGPLASIPRPITDAVLTFNNAQTGTVTILGARRPRRLSEFSENRGVAARDLNQAITDEIAMLRERWDYGLRSITGQPGEVLTPLPPAATRSNTVLGFNGSGQPSLVAPGLGAGNVVSPAGVTNNDLVCYNGTTGAVIEDCGAALPLIGSHIASATVTGSNIASGTVTGSNIASGTVANSNLANMAGDTIKCNNTSSPAAPSDCSNIALTPAQNTIGVSVLETTDTSWSTLFGTPTAIFATHGNQNNLVGYALNDLAPATTSLPVGTTGFGKVAAGANGNQVFGLYGLSELHATGGGVAIAAEMTCRNFSGNSPDTGIPTNNAIGTTTSVCNALQLTAGGGGNSSVGLQISSEGGSSQVFNTAIGITSQSYAEFGIFVDAQASGNQTTQVLRNNGTGVNLSLQTTGALAANNSVITYTDGGSVLRAKLAQIGDFSAHAWLSSGQSVPALGTCTNLGTGGSCSLDTGSNDGAGTVTLTTGTASTGSSGNVPLTFASAVGGHESGCVVTLVTGATGWPGNSFGTISSQTTTVANLAWIAGATLTTSTTYKFNYFCPGH
jgi:hypothetical protein